MTCIISWIFLKRNRRYKPGWPQTCYVARNDHSIRSFCLCFPDIGIRSSVHNHAQSFLVLELEPRAAACWAGGTLSADLTLQPLVDWVFSFRFKPLNQRPFSKLSSGCAAFSRLSYCSQKCITHSMVGTVKVAPFPWSSPGRVHPMPYESLIGRQESGERVQ